MKVFDLELLPSMIQEIAAHAERDSPIEACGVSVRAGKRSDMAAFKYDSARQTFEEMRIPLAEYSLPDLELRAMEGRETARPIRPYGGLLMPRRVTPDERVRIEQLVDRVQV